MPVYLHAVEGVCLLRVRSMAIYNIEQTIVVEVSDPGSGGDVTALHRLGKLPHFLRMEVHAYDHIKKFFPVFLIIDLNVYTKQCFISSIVIQIHHDRGTGLVKTQ